MSVYAQGEVWRRSRHKGSALLVLLYLADCGHDDGGSIYPSVRRIAQYTRLSERSVQYNLRTLIESGEVETDGVGPKGVTRYRIRLDRLGPVIVVPARGEAGYTGEKIALVQDAAAGGANDGQPGVQPVAPKPLGEPLEEPSIRAAATQPAAEPPVASLRDRLIAGYAQAANRNGFLGDAFRDLFGVAPDYGRIGKLAKRIGSGTKLLELMIAAAARPLAGDPHDYVTKLVDGWLRDAARPPLRDERYWNSGKRAAETGKVVL